MEMKLELVPVPVTDLDRAKAFYSEKLDFNVDHDTKINDEVRIIQLAPPGSACSIVISKGIPTFDEMPPGAIKALHLVVGNIEKTRDEYVGRGVDIAEITDH